MKKFLTCLISIALAVCMGVTVAACKKDKPSGNTAVELTISKETATIDITKENTLQLSASVKPQGDYMFSWSSDNKSVATVDANGLVSAVAAGDANVTVSCRKKGTTNTLASKVCKVKVVTPEGYYSVITGTSGVAQNDIVKNDPGKWYFYYDKPQPGAVYAVNDDLTMNITDLKGTWYLRYYPEFTAGTLLDVSFTVTLDAAAYLRISAGGKVANGGVSYEYLEAGTHNITAQRMLGDIPFSLSLTTRVGVDAADGVNDSFYAGDLDFKVTNLTFSEAVKLTDVNDNVVSKAVINFVKGEKTLQLYATPPANAPEIVWSSSEQSVATVDQNGLVTGIVAGKTIITAASGEKKATCEVSVVEREVTISKTYAQLNLADNPSLKLKLTASDDKPVEAVWSSDNENVATVSQSGEVTPLSEGVANIKAVVDGVDIICKVVIADTSATPAQYEAALDKTAAEVMDNPGKWYSVASHAELTGMLVEGDKVTLTKTGSNARTLHFLYQPAMPIGTKYSVTFTMANSNANGWGSTENFYYGTGTGRSGSNVADEEGIVTEHKEALKNTTGSQTFSGTFTVEQDEPFFISIKTAKGEFEITDIAFTVVESADAKLTGISSQVVNLKLDGEEAEKTAKLTVTTSGVDYDNFKLEWTSSDDGVATVDENGVITAVAAGTATITVTDGAASFNCIVTVSDETSVPEVFLVGISPESLTLDKAGESYDSAKKLEITLSGEGECSLTFASDNESVAVVDSEGYITAVAAGTAKVTVSDGKGNVKTCNVTVVNSNAAKLTSISNTGAILDLAEEKTDKTIKLTATVLGDGAEDVTVSWTSDNQAVATVDQNGNVTAVAAGVANITASDGTAANDKTCKVVVANSADIQATYDIVHAEGTTADTALTNPGTWYAANNVSSTGTDKVGNIVFADGGISVTGKQASEFDYVMWFQPFMQVGAKYTVSFNISRQDPTKSWGSKTTRLQFGTGTAYVSNVPEDGSIVDGISSLNATGETTYTGTFTVEENKPFFIILRSAVTDFKITGLTFTPVTEG